MTRSPLLLLVLLLPLFSGCSTLKSTDDPTSQISSDPIEGFNRSVYAFNDGADKLILLPVAKTYDKVLPRPIKNGVSNFFSNLSEPLNIVNNLLQGKWERSLSSTYRFAVNSTVGLFGLIDVAKKHEVDVASEDLGQTLASWGVGPGPYLMLPFLGPTNFRDGIGRITSGSAYFPTREIGDDSGTHTALNILQVIDLRVSLLGTDKLLEQQIDQYSFLKSAFEQNRLRSIYDGSPPKQEETYDF
jgi:phospholipid-binding lipoprotein MlaA